MPVRLISVRREPAWALSLVLALATSCSLSLQAQDKALTSEETAHARQLFEAGVAAYDAGRYGDALTQFQDAYRIKPHPLVRVNIANCYDKLGRPLEAIENFEAYLASPQSDPAERDEVRSALKELQKRVGQVAFSVTPDRARVLVDDRDERRAPISEPVRLTEGRHRVTVSLEGYETALRVVDVRPQETVQLRIDLVALPTAEPAVLATAPGAEPPEPRAADSAVPAPAADLQGVVVTPPPLPESAPATEARPRSGLPDSVWISGGITLALSVTAVITGQLALAANREFNSDLAAVRNPQLNEFQRAGAWERGVDASNRANGLAAATDVLLGFAVIGAGLTTYFCLTHHDDAPGHDSAGVSASLGPSGGRLQWHGHF